MTLLDGYAAMDEIEKHLADTGVDLVIVRECFQHLRWADLDRAAGRAVDAERVIQAGYKLLAALAEAAGVVCNMGDEADALRGDDE